ncbi:putative carbohydrate binding domain containing protein [uncultured Mediterranean phage uvMED]|nr:putative carbohydrate binding domain containing protein [uncultured Mediterranean phage uvMED]
MATLNLGAIRYNWKGAYDGSAAYVVNDVVSANGNSYICIQAGTGQAVGNATAYWNIMSSAGTNGTNGSNGTDVGTVITTQGDILYRDGSGLQRLAKGTAGKALLMNSSANAPEWGDAGGGVLQIKRGIYSGTSTFNSTSGYAAFGSLNVAITPTKNNSSFWINAIVYGAGNGNSAHDTAWKYNVSDSQVGATTAIFTDQTFSNASGVGGTSHFGQGSWAANGDADNYYLNQKAVGGMYTPSSNNGNARTFQILCRNNTDGTVRPNMTLDSGRGAGGVSTIEVWEIANGIYS